MIPQWALEIGYVGRIKQSFSEKLNSFTNRANSCGGSLHFSLKFEVPEEGSSEEDVEGTGAVSIGSSFGS